MFEDTDTKVLLDALHVRNNPLSWFWTDWPLQNHFYRPISTLFFEWDERLHPGSASGFGLTNALIACACVLALFWLLREATESPWFSGCAATVFGLWHFVGFGADAVGGVFWILACVPVLGILRGGKASLLPCLLAMCTLAYLSQLVMPVMPFGLRVINWLPGRTASTMTLFALISMSAYARFERLSAGRMSRAKPSALDVPATKGAEAIDEGPAKSARIWAAVSLAGLALALGCHEQAVMLPAELVALAVLFRVRRRTPHWAFHAAPWIVLLAYVALRSRIVPMAASGYQLQQFRNGPGVVLSLADYGFPAYNWATSLVLSMTGGALMLLIGSTWASIATIIGDVTGWWLAWKHDLRWLTLGFFSMSFLAYLPMAWLQQFGHYHYWPSAMRAAFLVGLLAVAAKALVSAISLPRLQAPKRLRPAPGSLPRQ